MWHCKWVEDVVKFWNLGEILDKDHVICQQYNYTSIAGVIGIGIKIVLAHLATILIHVLHIVWILTKSLFCPVSTVLALVKAIWEIELLNTGSFIYWDSYLFLTHSQCQHWEGRGWQNLQKRSSLWKWESTKLRLFLKQYRLLSTSWIKCYVRKMTIQICSQCEVFIPADDIYILVRNCYIRVICPYV